MAEAALQVLVEMLRAATASAAESARASAEAARLGQRSADVRLLEKPKKLAPSTRDEEQQKWAEWKADFKNYIICVQPEYAAELAHVEGTRAIEEEVEDMDEPVASRCVLLYGLLAQLVGGRLGRLVREHQEGRHGPRAWLALINELEPVDRSRGLAMLQALASQEGWPKDGDFTDQVREYERRVMLYEQASGKKLDMDIQIAMLLRNAPLEVQTQLRLRVTAGTNYSTVRQILLEYELAKRPWAAATFPTASNSSSARPDPDAMQVDAVKGQGTGTSKNKGAKGIDGGKGLQSDDICRTCGGRGHGAKDCPSGSAASNPLVASGTGKGKGKGKGKTKDGSKGKGKDSHLQFQLQFNGTCSHCGKWGHMKKDCYKLVAELGGTSNSAGKSMAASSVPSSAGVSALQERHDSWRLAASALQLQPRVRENLLLMNRGSDEPVCPLHFSSCEVTDPPETRMWDATGKHIENYGSKNVHMTIVDGNIPCTAKFQVANVAHSVLSVGKLVNSGRYRVELDNDGSWLINKITGERARLEHKGNTFFLKAYVNATKNGDNMEQEPMVFDAEAVPQALQEGPEVPVVVPQALGGRASFAQGSVGHVDEVPRRGPAGLSAWSPVSGMRIRLRELKAPIWGTKEQLWARLVDYETQHAGEQALREKLARALAERREGQAEVAPRPLPQPVEPREVEKKAHEVTHIPSKSWRRWCVLGKAKQRAHRQIVESDRELEAPTAHVDYRHASTQLHVMLGQPCWLQFMLAQA